MTPWQQFYNRVKDPSWPSCEREEYFVNLPEHIQKECIEVHGYTVGEYKHQPAMIQKKFPIESKTSCQLKWNWSTVYLTTEHTASCHRTNHHKFDTDSFDFHNTPSKIDDREKMLQGMWPKKGCDYCKKIEDSGGQSDRITNLNMAGIHSPPEIDDDNKTAVNVTPRILEVYFDNTCNLKCVYCGSHFSSLWDKENTKFGEFEQNGVEIPGPFLKSSKIDENTKKIFEWLKVNGQSLTNFNILGGEPLYQTQFDQCLEFFWHYPAPLLDLQIFTNLNVPLKKVESTIEKTRQLREAGKIKKFTITASLDCWGESQEYARYPLDLVIWERNFERLLEEAWIKLVIGSTITPLTIKTLPDLIKKINKWNHIRPVYQYFNSVDRPEYMNIDMFGDLFQNDFNKAVKEYSMCPTRTENAKKYLQGIATQSKHTGINKKLILKLKTFLDELDRRRKTDWRETFPWLIGPIEKNT